MVLLGFLGGATSLPATVLWNDPGAVLVHESGPGRDILNGAVKRDDASRDTLYFRLHISPLSDSSTEEYFAGLELFEGDAERIGVGNALPAYAYSIFFRTHESEEANPLGNYLDLHSANVEPSGSGAGSSYELPRRGQERTIIFKVQYVPNGDDLITVWLNPDLSAGATEIHQSESLTTRLSANVSFDEIRLRHGGRGDGWVFTDLAVATSFNDFVDPGRAISSTTDPGRFFDLQPFSFDSWLRDTGMPQAPIHSLAQTTDGYLWLAGAHQLSRFDGARFVPVALPLPMAGDPISVLFADSRGALWVGTRSRGLARFSRGSFEQLTAPPELMTNRVTSMTERKDGALWIGTTRGLLLWNGERIQKVPEMGSLDPCEIKSLWEDTRGTLWIVAEGKGVFQLQEGTLSHLKDPRVDSLLSEAQSLLVDRGGNLWIGAGDDFVLCREGTEWRRYRTPRQSSSSAIRLLAATPDGTVWAGSANEGLFRLRQGNLLPFTPGGNLTEGQVSALFVDRGGNLWVGSGAGLHRLKPKHIFHLGQAEGLARGPVSGIAEVSPGVIWITQPGHGLYRWEGDTFRRLSAAGLSATDRTLGPMLMTSNRACWLACTNGLLLFRDPQAAADESQLFELPGATITALAEDSGGTIWAGTRQGQLWLLEKGRWRRNEQFAPTSPVTCLLAEDQGSVYVGTDGAGLYLVDSAIRAHFDKRSGLTDDSILALCPAESGTLWVGTGDGGLSAISNRVCVVVLNSARSPLRSVQGILKDEFDRLWLHQNASVVRLTGAGLGQHGLDLPENYLLQIHETDTTFPGESKLQTLPQLREHSAGRLWFGCPEGIVVVEPRNLSTNRPTADLFLEEVLVDGVVAPVRLPFTAGSGQENTIPELQIGPGPHRLDIRFTSPRFGEPENARFRYRLEGLDSDWIEAGTTRLAQYSYVPAGNYRFTVELHGPENTSRQACLKVGVAPAFWQRPWVVGFGAVAVLALSGGLVRFLEHRRMKGRLSRLEEQNLLESERIRIAQDLHDEMGAKLCRISFLSEHANRLGPNSDQLKDQVATIAHDSRELLLSLDEIVWAVNPHNDTLEHVGSYIGQYAQEYLQGTGIECVLDIPNHLPHRAVSSQIRHHLFLTVHEALTNVLKHSGATQVKIAIACAGGELQIRVEDNGQGFDPPETLGNGTDSESSGNGLRNMRRRIEAIGGRCEILTQPHQGTSIQLALNLALPTPDAHT
jgi:signal transduction histidine kinase/ligand-binding sensor domain-containing protein